MEKEGGSSTGTSIFPGMEFNLEPGPLKELSPEKIKEEIKRWAKAVVTYARQLSFEEHYRLQKDLTSTRALLVQNAILREDFREF
ncbi:hypothetical protein FCM35_KLT06926 [Carex littledalei]|uniref:Uncharacterized protein n=1 Tax=Carex littledalei TaxID=544730 RepID=A0A833VIW4_9POAL|nr:hypothetical protein FCM35_KLT06926 [Carex littledalei]